MLSPRALVRGNPARAKFAAENLWCFHAVSTRENISGVYLISYHSITDSEDRDCRLYFRGVSSQCPFLLTWFNLNRSMDK